MTSPYKPGECVRTEPYVCSSIVQRWRRGRTRSYFRPGEWKDRISDYARTDAAWNDTAQELHCYNCGRPGCLNNTKKNVREWR